MENKLIQCEWEEIQGFSSLGDYVRFLIYIERQVVEGCAKELDVDLKYERGLLRGGRWFKDLSSGQVWRLMPPDFPFRGLWEPVLGIIGV